jgi:hypothetical protein
VSTRRRDDSLTFTVMSLGRRGLYFSAQAAQATQTGPGARLADAPAAMQRRRDLYRKYVGDRAVPIFYCDAIHQ